MSIDSVSLGRHLCAVSRWTLNNQRLHKILYLAHMTWLGQTGEDLINRAFEAWDYGPVEPVLYGYARGFGTGPIKAVLGPRECVGDTPEAAHAADVLNTLIDVDGAGLVALTHRQDSGWAASYIPGANLAIPQARILADYHARVAMLEPDAVRVV